MGREVGVLRAGRLVQTARRPFSTGCPADLDVARFVGEAVVLPGTLARGVECALGTLPVRDGALTRARRHDDPARADPRGPAGAGRPRSPGAARARVVGHSFFGADTVLALELATGRGTARRRGLRTRPPARRARPVVGARPVVADPARCMSPSVGHGWAVSARRRSPRASVGMRPRAGAIAPRSWRRRARARRRRAAADERRQQLDRPLQRPAPRAHEGARPAFEKRTGIAFACGRTTASCSPTRSSRRARPRPPTST